MTAPAQGVHAHPTRKLGLRPNDPFKARLMLRSTGAVRVVPEHPLTGDLMTGVGLGMDLNDVAGTCVSAGFDNYRRMATTLLVGAATVASEQDIVTWYRTQNPRFNPTGDPNVDGPGSDADGGMVIQDFLAWLVKHGVILGFAAVAVSDEQMMQAANWLGMGPVCGVTLTAHQVGEQFDRGVWDEVGGQVVGGHCVPTGAYGTATTADGDAEDCATWQRRIGMTRRFLAARRDEAWAVLLPEHLSHPGFRAHFDLAAFAAAYTAITGRPFPADIPPGPTPPPAPPGPPPFPLSWIRRLLSWLGRVLGDQR